MMVNVLQSELAATLLWMHNDLQIYIYIYIHCFA